MMGTVAMGAVVRGTASTDGPFVDAAFVDDSLEDGVLEDAALVAARRPRQVFASQTSRTPVAARTPPFPGRVPDGGAVGQGAARP